MELLGDRHNIRRLRIGSHRNGEGLPLVARVGLHFEDQLSSVEAVRGKLHGGVTLQSGQCCGKRRIVHLPHRERRDQMQDGVSEDLAVSGEMARMQRDQYVTNAEFFCD